MIFIWLDEISYKLTSACFSLVQRSGIRCR